MQNPRHCTATAGCHFGADGPRGPYGVVKCNGIIEVLRTE